MGIRRHLKATLGLLAVGSVAFAGAAHAEGSNVLQVKQDASGTARIQNKDGNGKAVQKGKDVVYLKQVGKNVKLNLTQNGTGNKVGVDSKGNPAQLIMEAESKNNRYDVTLTVDQESNNNEIINEYAGETNFKATAGSIDVTITQQTNDGNKVKVGVITASSSDNGKAIALSVTQKGSDTSEFKNVQVGYMDLSVTQDGSSDLYFADAAGTTYNSNDSQAVKVTKGFTGTIDQSGASKAYFDQTTAESNLTVDIDQDASSIYFGKTNKTTAGAVDLKNDATIRLKQSSGSDFEANGVTVYGNTTIAGFDSNGVVSKTAQAEQNASTVELSNVTVGGTSNSAEFKMYLSQKNGTVTLEDSSFATNSGSATFKIKQKGSESDTVTFSQATLKGDTNVTITQEGKDKVTGNNKFIVGDNDEVKVDGSTTINVEQYQTDKDENLIDIKKATINGNLTMAGHSGNGDFTQYGSVNEYKIDNVKAAGNVNLYNTMGDKANGKAANSNDVDMMTLAGNNVTVDTNIQGSNNTFHISQDQTKTALSDISSNSGDITVNVNIKGDYVTIEGASYNTTSESWSAVEDGVTQLSNTNDKDNYLNVSVYSNADSSTKNEIYIYQNAGGSLQESGYTDYAAYANISMGSSNTNVNHNQLYLYQKSSSGGTLADIEVASSDNVIKIYQNATNDAVALVNQQ